MSWTNGPAPDPVALFLLHLDAQRGYSPATVAAYGTDLEGAHLFLARRSKGFDAPAAVTKADITAYLADLHRRGLAKSSVCRKLSALRAFYRFLRQRKMVVEDPCAALANPKLPKVHPKVLNVDQAIHLVETKITLDPEGLRDLALLEVLYGSDSHHMVEGLFKAFGRSLAEAIGQDGSNRLPSTKGRIEG